MTATKFMQRWEGFSPELLSTLFLQTAALSHFSEATLVFLCSDYDIHDYN